MVITIDGAAGVGKTTTAKELAKELGYQYFDTGAMYRAVTLYALRNNWINDSLDKLSINREKIVQPPKPSQNSNGPSTNLDKLIAERENYETNQIK